MLNEKTPHWGEWPIVPIELSVRIKTETELAAAIAEPSNWAILCRRLGLDLEPPRGAPDGRKAMRWTSWARIRETEDLVALELTIRPLDIDHARKTAWNRLLDGVVCSILIAPPGKAPLPPGLTRLGQMAGGGVKVVFVRLFAINSGGHLLDFEVLPLGGVGGPAVDRLAHASSALASGDAQLPAVHAGGRAPGKLATPKKAPSPHRKAHADLEAVGLIRGQLRASLIAAGLMRETGGRRRDDALVGKMGFGLKGANLVCTYTQQGVLSLALEITAEARERLGQSTMDGLEAEAIGKPNTTKAGVRRIIVYRAKLSPRASDAEIARACQQIGARTQALKDLRDSLPAAEERPPSVPEDGEADEARAPVLLEQSH